MAPVRRLTAMLAADVTGYSRLMGADEEGTHERLKGHLLELVNPKIEERRGRIVKNTGDGFLAEFVSVVDAVHCAVEIQRRMRDREAQLPERQRILFRIGINLGDVIAEDHDIFGDGVNIAARLQEIAEPAGICVSQVARDQVRGKLDFGFEDLGEQRVKNITRPIRVYRVRDLSIQARERLPVVPRSTAIQDKALGEEESFTFGAFSLIPAERVLIEGGRPVRLGSRAFDILVALIERPGQTVSKEELIARAWRDTVVEEAALRVHVAALRKALGDGRAGKRYIANHSGRGYAFIAPVTRKNELSATAMPDGADVAGSLPALLTRVVGRDDVVSRLLQQLVRRRFLTIVGAGGIGKTTVAVAVAGAARAAYEDGVWFVDLAALSDPDLVPSALGAALGIHSSGANPLPGLAAWLRDKHALIILDSCEHVVSAAAALAETVLKAAPHVSILTTSREPLRAEGESLHRLAALDIPPGLVDLGADDALRYSAVQLFNERASAAVDGFTLTDADIPAVLEICRRLDGIPLALELAAARVGVFGMRDLAAHLDDRFRLLTSGRRTALPRHQTLGAALDWSYQLLPEEERTVLCRLSAFAGEFPLEAAIAVAADPGPSDVVDRIANLVGKSLVAADSRGEVAQYRLLDTTRLYALDKLKSSGELQRVAQRHAEYYLAVFAPAEAESETRPQAEWLATYGRHIANVRAALDWAFSSDGEPQIGVALTIAVVPLWVQLSLLAECRERVERALAVLEGNDAATARQRMQLSWALGWSLMYGVGRAREAGPAWTTTLELAERLDDTVYRLRALWSSCIDQFNNGDLRTALDFARRFAGLTEQTGDAVDLTMADRLLATALHYSGDQRGARHHIDRALAQLEALAEQPQIVRVRFDMRISTHYFQARILWLQGFAEQALRVVSHNIEEGNVIGQALSFCSVLGQGACPIAFWAGDLDAAERYGAMLRDHTDRHPIRLWQIWARCFNGLVTARRGEIDAGLRALRGGLEQAGEARFLPRFLLLLGELAVCLGQTGEIALGLETVDEALARCEARGEDWYIPELLRIRGELILLQSAEHAFGAAEQHFRRALDRAHGQGALSWELRAATNLARLWRDRGSSAEARDLLGSIYRRFSEGFATADLQGAKNLLVQLT
jgi:predicted ATPase/class 3 adenylate cyclase/DNA-binding winged helix-turn-helix (wHTH) protein